MKLAYTLMVLPIARRPLQALTRDDVGRMYGQLLAGGASERKATMALWLLNDALEYAHNFEFVATNPVPSFHPVRLNAGTLCSPAEARTHGTELYGAQVAS